MMHRLESPAAQAERARRHSPWTAQRQRKKNKQADDELPACISDAENEDASTSRDCEDMILDLQHLGLGAPHAPHPHPGPSVSPSAHAVDPAPAAARTERSLFMPAFMGPPAAGRADPGGFLRTLGTSAAAAWGSLGDAGGPSLRGASSQHHGGLQQGVSPRRNSASLVLDQSTLVSGALLACLRPVALSTDHVPCGTSAAAIRCSLPSLSGAASATAAIAVTAAVGDDQRRSTKRRSLERGDGSLAHALRASGKDSVRGSCGSGSVGVAAAAADPALLPAAASSPAAALQRQQRRRACVLKSGVSASQGLGRPGDQASQRDQHLAHPSKSLPGLPALESQGPVGLVSAAAGTDTRQVGHAPLAGSLGGHGSAAGGTMGSMDGGSALSLAHFVTPEVACKPFQPHQATAGERAVAAGDAAAASGSSWASAPAADEGFRISTVLTGNDPLELTGSSDRLAMRDQHLRAAIAVAARRGGGGGGAAASAPAAAAVAPGSFAFGLGGSAGGTTADASPVLGGSWSAGGGGGEGLSEEFEDENGGWPQPFQSQGEEDEYDEREGGEQRGYAMQGAGIAALGCCSPMEGMAVRLTHSEEDFRTPGQSPDDKRIAAKAAQLLASCCMARRMTTQDHGHERAGGRPGDSDAPLPAEQCCTLEEFNKQLYQAAHTGNRGRANCLWAELCSKGVAPDMNTLNSLLRCLANSFARPDEAETLAREVCRAGKISPNAVTFNLLAETRFRYEQLCGYS